MKALKNIGVGFLVSFMGSIPLGYLNVIGFQIYERWGLLQSVFYLLGVIVVEFFVIYFTLIFANQLANNIKLTKYIEVFSIVFIFSLVFVFYFNSNLKTNSTNFFHYSPFVLGLVLSCLNFIQIPFWTGWNLYLLNGNYIEVSKSRKYFYVFGTVAGTFVGMLVLILSLNFFTNQTDFLAKYLMKAIIPLVFLGLGIYQGIQFYKKY